MRNKNLPLKLFMLIVFSLIITTNMPSSNPTVADTALPMDTQYKTDNSNTLLLAAQKFGISVDSLKKVNQIKKLTIVIDKSDHTLSLVSDGIRIRTYSVELGSGGIGDKQVSGDNKTPEGNFYVAEKSVINPADYYLGTRWLRISYPNIEDAKRGLKQDLISKSIYNRIINAVNHKQIPPQKTTLGGGVGIHGGNKPELGSDWTWGCIGLANKDIEDFFNYVNVGTPIIIQK